MTRTLRLLAPALACAPLILFGLAAIWLHGHYELPGPHFFLVVGCSLLAAAVAVLITRASLDRNDLRGGLVGLAFTLMAGLLAVHGLATPGVFLPEYGHNATVGLAGVLAVPLGGIVLAAAVLAPAVAGGTRVLVLRLQALTVLALAAFGLVGLMQPALVPLVPLSIQPWALVVLLPTMLLYTWVARRALGIHQLTRRRADLWVAIGLVWLGCSIAFYMLSPVWSLGFWWGHMLELAGFVAVAGSVAVDLTNPRPSHMLHGELRGGDLIEGEESLLGGYVRALTASMELRDPSTGAHSRRVAVLAVQVGEAMGLSRSAVRRLAVAGLVHDIGKLQVPESILNKPGRLTGEEFAVIRTHPGRGAELLLRLGGFGDEVPIVLAHHERFTGGGYPQGISGEEIPLEARILTACDVFDALTSSRSYREPWPVERAVELLRDESGTTFDPACVEALLRVVSGSGEARVALIHQVLSRRPATA